MPHLTAAKDSVCWAGEQARSYCLLGLEHALAEGVADQLVAVAETEFLHDPLAVGVDRFGADDELLGDLGAAVAFGDQLEDLPLALRQAVERLLFARRSVEIAVDQQFGRGGVQKDLATVNRADRLDQLGVGAGFEDVTRAARLQ